MPYYSPERRAALLKMLLPPLNLSMAEVSRREGVSEMSLSNWRKQLSSEGSAVSENKQSIQNWSAETKFAVVLEAAGLSEIDLIDTDIAAIETELELLQIAPAPAQEKQKTKCRALPPEFPRRLIHHEPDNTQCSCGCVLKRIGEDVSEKLDYTPGVFTVERHIRDKWVCDAAKH